MLQPVLSPVIQFPPAFFIVNLNPVVAPYDLAFFHFPYEHMLKPRGVEGSLRRAAVPRRTALFNKKH